MTFNITAYWQLLRVKHYIKNGFVLLPVFFAAKFTEQDIWLSVGLAFFAFCLAASGIYILNDYKDLEDDKKHPTKSKRPLAAGTVSVGHAFVMLSVCWVLALACAWLVNPKVLLAISVYIALNIAYSGGLKHQAIIDVACVAMGFVIRLWAGA